MTAIGYGYYLQEEIDKFTKQHGIYPEKVIMNKYDHDMLLRELNAAREFTDEVQLTKVTGFKGVQIEIDDTIKDWIIVAPEHN